MLKEFAQYLVSLKDNKTYEINGQTYSDRDLTLIKEPTPRPSTIDLTGLDGIVQMIRAEGKKITPPIFIQIVDPKTVTVYSALDVEMKRSNFCRATCDIPGYKWGFQPYQNAIIELRSRYIPNKDVEYLLDLLARVNTENGVTTSDNGVTQTVEARSGVSLKSVVSVRPRVTLAPFRTFREVAQPESEFVLRLDDNANVGLFEADGGMWMLKAKENIRDYFNEQMKAEIDAGEVVVTM